MNRKLAAAAIAGSLTFAGIAGATLATPMLVGAAQEDSAESTPPGQWVTDVLDQLIAGGTLTQEQADTVAAALEEARPERPGGRHGEPAIHSDVVADALGMTAEELRTALSEGSTIAEIAADNDVDVQTVIDALVAELESGLDEKVADGTLTQEEADERLASATERITDFVNNGGPRMRGPHGPGSHGPESGDDTLTDAEADAGDESGS